MSSSSQTAAKTLVMPALLFIAFVATSVATPQTAVAQQKDYFVTFVNHRNDNVELSVTFPQPEFLGTIVPGASDRWDFSHGEIVEGRIRGVVIGRVTIQSAGTIPIGSPRQPAGQSRNTDGGGQPPVSSGVRHQVTIWNETNMDVNVMFNGSLHDRLGANGSQGAVVSGLAGQIIQIVNANTLQPLGQHVIQRTETINFNVGQQLTDRQIEAKVLELINRFRAENGLRPLVMNSFMSNLARQHSVFLCQQGSVDFNNAHAGFDGRHQQILQNVPRVVFRGGPQGESVAPASAAKFDPANDIVENWKRSTAGHPEGLIVRAQGVGIAGVGFARINGKAYCTLLLAETD